MAKNTVVDGYAIGNDGTWIKDGGWKKDSIGWWYSYGSGCGYAIGWKSFENPFYDHYNKSKKLNPSHTWYYFDSNGYMKTGWIQSGGKWYYLNSDGKMAVNETINGYVIDEKGEYVERLGQVKYHEDFVTIPEKTEYPLGTTTVKFDIINNTGNVYETFVGPVDVEKFEDGKWTYMVDKRTEKQLEDGICISTMPLDVYNIYSSEATLSELKDFDSSKTGKYRIAFGPTAYCTNRFVEFEIK